MRNLHSHWNGCNPQDRQNQELVRIWRNWSPHSGGDTRWEATLENSLALSSTSEIWPLLDIYSRELKTYIHTKTWMYMFVAVLIHNSQKLEAIQMSITRCIDKENVEYPYNRIFSTIKCSEILINAATWVNLKHMMLREARCKRLHVAWFHLHEMCRWRRRADQWFPRPEDSAGRDGPHVRRGKFLRWWKSSKTRLWCWLHNSIIY